MVKMVTLSITLHALYSVDLLSQSESQVSNGLEEVELCKMGAYYRRGRTSMDTNLCSAWASSGDNMSGQYIF